jgi:hypothetical protein
MHKMDNETSKDIKKFIKANNTTLQNTPPDINCTNSAKRAIRTWKNHFIAGIASLPTGAASQTSETTQLTRSVHAAKTWHYQPSKQQKDSSPSMQHQWHCQAQKSS